MSSDNFTLSLLFCPLIPHYGMFVMFRRLHPLAWGISRGFITKNPDIVINQDKTLVIEGYNNCYKNWTESRFRTLLNRRQNNNPFFFRSQAITARKGHMIPPQLTTLLANLNIYAILSVSPKIQAQVAGGPPI